MRCRRSRRRWHSFIDEEGNQGGHECCQDDHQDCPRFVPAVVGLLTTLILSALFVLPTLILLLLFVLPSFVLDSPFVLPTKIILSPFVLPTPFTFAQFLLKLSIFLKSLLLKLALFFFHEHVLMFLRTIPLTPRCELMIAVSLPMKYFQNICAFRPRHFLIQRPSINKTDRFNPILSPRYLSPLPNIRIGFDKFFGVVSPKREKPALGALDLIHRLYSLWDVPARPR